MFLAQIPAKKIIFTDIECLTFIISEQEKMRASVAFYNALPEYILS